MGGSAAPLNLLTRPMQLSRNPVITIYEASANPADHKTRADATGIGRLIG